MSYERENIAKMQGYVSGEQPTNYNAVKLNTNENPYPASPTINRVIQEFNIEKLRQYPPPLANEFRHTAANLHKVNIDNIIATRGGDELLRLIITTFVDPGETIAMSDPTYSLYPVLAEIQNCPIFKIPLDINAQIPTDFAKRINNKKAKLTFVVNPHAPTGQLLKRDQIRELAESLDSILLIDEAYVDFIDPAEKYNCLSLIEEFDNIIFLRTLSKGYSLAGLRFGYGIGPECLISPMLHKTRDSYNLDLLSQLIATTALKDQTHAKASWHAVRKERSRMRQAFDTFGFSSLPSQSNFILINIPDTFHLSAEEIYLALKKQGLYVRFFKTYDLINKLRITIGTPLENNKLLDKIDYILKDTR